MVAMGKKILFILEYFPPHVGGVETLFDKLTKMLADEGHDVHIYTSRVEDSEKFEVSHGRKIYRRDIPFRHGFALPDPKLVGLIKDSDVIHTTSYVATGTTWINNLFESKPVIATFHEVWDSLFFEFQNLFKATGNWFLESLMCNFYRDEVLTCPSRYTKNCMINKGVPEENINVIYHGIDRDIFNEDVEPLFDFDFPTYLFYGRPGISKGLPYLLEAVKKVSNKIPDAKLVLMVSKQSKQYKKLIRRINELGIEDNIIQIDRRENFEDVPRVIKSADIVTVPSLTEGFCFNAVESQACGVPVVASMAGSLPEVVEGGLFVQPRNSSDIAEKVITLLRDDDLREELGKRGVGNSKRFTWDRALNKYLELYNNFLD